jgi:putative FmdB family regulatory protein
MPLYQQKCTECGKEFEHIASIHDDSIVPCEHCNAATTQRVPSAFRTERRFAGTKEMTSQRYEFIPQEVERIRQLTADSGATVHDNGKVTFASRGEEQRFHKAMERMTEAPVSESSDDE